MGGVSMSESNFDMYTLEDVANKLHIHINTARNYIKSGRLKAVKIGRRFYVSAENLRSFLNGE